MATEPMTRDELQAAVQARIRVRAGEARSLRIEHGLTLEQLAGVVGTTTSTLNRWELGTVPIPLSKALTLMGTLDNITKEQQ